MNEISEKRLKLGRTMYILQADLEYLISLLVGGSFLATLTTRLGFSDGLTGVLSSVISLGCVFQLISAFIRRSSYKWLVIALSIINQALFSALYLIPLIAGRRMFKTVLFAAVLFLAYFIYNLAHPLKISWLMSLVDDKKRGIFTSNKEIVSLISGMIFSFLMGALIDRFAERGAVKTAFLLTAGVMFAVTVLCTMTMVLSPEKKTEQTEKCNPFSAISGLIHNRKLMAVIGIFVLYYISVYIATPFYGVYQIKELGMSLKYVTVLTFAGSLVRIFVSRMWGRLADKTSFAEITEKCMLILAFGYVAVVFSTDVTGKITFLLYYLLQGIAMGGISSATFNLVFDYAPTRERAAALALCQAASGLCGFFTTIAVSPLVSVIQSRQNTVFGIHMYAQQLLSLVAALVTLGTVLLTHLALVKKRAS